MNIEQEIIKRYTSNKKIKDGYFLRIREEQGKTNIKVYYHGIKMMEWSKSLSINTAIFVPNASNVFEGKKLVEYYKIIPSAVKEDMKKIETYFEFSIGSNAKGETRKGKKLDIRFSTGTLTHTKEELLNIIVEHLKKTNMFSHFTDIVLNRNKTQILLFLKETKYTLEELYDLILSLLEVTLRNCELQKIAIDIKSMPKIETINFDEIENVLKNRIEVYIKEDKNRIDDYENSKSKTNQEKQKQQDFMALFTKEKKDDILYQTKEKIALLYSKNTVPFELEYTIYAGNDREAKKERSNIKGRIDNVVVDKNVLHLVEIKYGTGVIAGTNGIHKHLIDLYSCLNISSDVMFNEFEERIEFRNKVLKGPTQTIKLDRKCYYDIVCIYEKNAKEETLSKEAVFHEIQEIYEKRAIDKTVKCNIKNNKIIDIVPLKNKNANQYSKELLEKNIGELCAMLKSKNCIVRILIVDDAFHFFEEYQN